MNPDGVKGKREKKPPRREAPDFRRGTPYGAPRDRRGGESGGPPSRDACASRARAADRDPADPETPIVRIRDTPLRGVAQGRVLGGVDRRRSGGPSYGRVERDLERGIRTFVGRYAPTGNRFFVRSATRNPTCSSRWTSPQIFRRNPGTLSSVRSPNTPKGRRGAGSVVRALGKSHTMETSSLR